MFFEESDECKSEWQRCKGEAKVRIDGWSKESLGRQRYGCEGSERAS